MFDFRALLLTAILVAPSAPWTSVRTDAPATHRVEVRAHGVALSLRVPAGSYPEDALVRVVVELRNVSHHGILVGARGPVFDGYENLQVEVLTPAGQVVYPPAIQNMVPPPGPSQHFFLLKRGEYVILRAPMVQARVAIGYLATPGKVDTVRTPLARVSLTPGTAPAVTLHVSTESTYADVQPASSSAGSLFYIGSATCQKPNAPAIPVSAFLWAKVQSSRVLPGCSPVSAWHAAVGRLNQPVAYIDYVRSTG